jgi:glycogen(starch) synthase
VLCLGDVAPHKGFDIAVRALPLLLRRFPTLRLVVAGDGPSSDALRRLAAREGVSGALALVGAVPHDDAPCLMNEASVVAVPSRRESFSLVALEAALMARPVVAARVDGLPEVVAHGETGLLVEPENPAALAAAIGMLLESPATAARLGNEARRRARRQFGVRRQVDAYRHLHRRIVAAPASHTAAAEADRACE